MKNTSEFWKGFISGVIYCAIVVIIMSLFSCTPSHETVYYPSVPRHSGVYVENDSIVNGDTLYFWKK